MLPDRPIENKVLLYSPESPKPLGKIYPSYSPSVSTSKASSSSSLVSQPLTSSSLANIKSPSLGFFVPVTSPSVGTYSSSSKSQSVKPTYGGSSSIGSSKMVSSYSYGYTSSSLSVSPNTSTSPYNYGSYRSPLSNMPSLPIPPGLGRPRLIAEVPNESKRKKGGKQRKKYRPDLIGRVLNIKAAKGS